jgi:hypothetical protein
MHHFPNVHRHNGADRGILALVDEPLGERHRGVLGARRRYVHQTSQIGIALLGAGEERTRHTWARHPSAVRPGRRGRPPAGACVR